MEVLEGDDDPKLHQLTQAVKDDHTSANNGGIGLPRLNHRKVSQGICL